MGRKKKREADRKIAARVPRDRDQALHYCTPENVVLVIASKLTHPNMCTHPHTHTYQNHISSSYCKPQKKSEHRHV